MSVTPADLLARVLPVVISGGRPALADRPTSKFLYALRGVTADPVWLVRDDHAAGYEADGEHELVTFPVADAEAYAAEHWIGEDPFEAGSFLGAFTNREWACRLAEERGCWAVLQLDDNLRWLGLFAGGGATVRVTKRAGGLGFFADILAAVTLATNSRMTGAKLDAVVPGKEPAGQFARAGFPYSLFVERTGPGRLPYYGPGEDDILHAYQYASDPTAATAAIVSPLHYRKEHSSASGMRGFYASNRRAVGIQRVAPEIVNLRVMAAKSNGRGEPRVFHRTPVGAIRVRSPLVVLDRPLYNAARAVFPPLAAEILAEHRLDVAAKVARRFAKYETEAAS